jgi:hypothetical protein
LLATPKTIAVRPFRSIMQSFLPVSRREIWFYLRKEQDYQL